MSTKKEDKDDLTSDTNTDASGQTKKIIFKQDDTIKQSLTDKQKLNDFNQHGDDRKRMSSKQLAKMNRYQQFEKLFPFYLMDVNGFMHRVKQAMVAQHPEHKDDPWHIETISLETMAEAFKTHNSWSDL